MSDRMHEVLARLDAAIGVSGDEVAVATVIRDELAGFYDEHVEDSLGNNDFVKRGVDGAPTVMLCAHMDEIGFVVQSIEEAGFVRIAPVGFHDARMVIDQRLTIHGESGPVEGVTGAKPAHVLTVEEQTKVIPLEELFVDVGSASAEETEEMGIHIGQVATFSRTGACLNETKVFTGKAVDDRAGCAVMVEVMRRLPEHDIAATVCATAAVQEELGIRGAAVSGFRVQPDVALAIDVTLCGDTPGIELSRLPIKLGAGPAIKYFDWAPSMLIGSAVPRRLTKRLEEVATGAGVTFQREVLLGGATDAWGISLSGRGILTGCISLPSRYIHSAVGCVHLDDLEGAVSLILAFLGSVRDSADPLLGGAS